MAGSRVRPLRMSGRGSEFADLLTRYRSLSDEERARMRALSPDMTMADVSAIARDRQLSSRMSDFYDDEFERLDLSGRAFASMMLVTVGLAMFVIGVLN